MFHQKNMIRGLGVALTIVGMASLILGVLGIFGKDLVAEISPWALTILGFIFFSSGVGILKKSEN